MSDQTPNAISSESEWYFIGTLLSYSIFWTTWTATFYQCHGYIFDTEWYKLGQEKLDKAYKFQDNTQKCDSYFTEL